MLDLPLRRFAKTFPNILEIPLTFESQLGL
jgi:hypothetical protein